MEKIKIRVNFGQRPIYAISVQCPSCKNWFDSVDILKYPNFLHNDGDLAVCDFECPICHHEFEHNEVIGNDEEDLEIIECADEEEVYRECLHKKVIWE